MVGWSGVVIVVVQVWNSLAGRSSVVFGGNWLDVWLRIKALSGWWTSVWLSIRKFSRNYFRCDTLIKVLSASLRIMLSTSSASSIRIIRRVNSGLRLWIISWANLTSIHVMMLVVWIVICSWIMSISLTGNFLLMVWVQSNITTIISWVFSQVRRLLGWRLVLLRTALLGLLDERGVIVRLESYSLVGDITAGIVVWTHAS